MSRRWVIAVVASAIGFAGCNDAKQRSASAASAADFWPEAPRPTVGGPRTFKYNPDNVRGYAISIDAGALPGSAARTTVKLSVAVGFDAGTAPRSRDARFRRIDFDADAAGRKMEMHLDADQLTARDGTSPTITRKRGDPGPLDVAALVDRPFTTLIFTENNKVERETNRGHPFAAVGGDLLDTALVLFPDLPSGPVRPGHTWTLLRNVSLAQGLGRTDVTYTFEYVGDSACPSLAGTCAQITLTASSKDVEIEQRGMKLKLAYAFAGKVFFDVDQGSIAESRVHMDIDANAQGQTIAMGGVVIIKPI